MKLDFEQYVDPDLAARLLNVKMDDKLVNQERLAKAFYTFDFNSVEGITTFLSVLPVLEKDVVSQAQEQLIPNSVDDSFDLQRSRFELRGYLIDVLQQGLVGSEEEPLGD